MTSFARTYYIIWKYFFGIMHKLESRLTVSCRLGSVEYYSYAFVKKLWTKRYYQIIQAILADTRMNMLIHVLTYSILYMKNNEITKTPSLLYSYVTMQCICHNPNGLKYSNMTNNERFSLLHMHYAKLYFFLTCTFLIKKITTYDKRVHLHERK